MANRTRDSGRKKGSKLGYTRAAEACESCRERRVRCLCPEEERHAPRKVGAKQPKERVRRACDDCRQHKTRCEPVTEDRCLRCSRLHLTDCNFEVRETSQGKPASQGTARSLFFPPSGEPEPGTIDEYNIPTLAPAMVFQEAHTSVAMDGQQHFGVGRGSSATKHSPASRPTALLGPEKPDKNNVLGLLQNMPSSGPSPNASLLSMAVPPFMPMSKLYWHGDATPQRLDPPGDSLSLYQLSSTSSLYTASHGVEAFDSCLTSDGLLSEVGYNPSRLGEANHDWQAQQYLRLDEQQNQQWEMLLTLQSMPGHWLGM